MTNDRDKFENSEEYHFSDEEDIHYEIENEPLQSVAESNSPSSGMKESIINRLTQSKRTLISIAVFISLVFVVYKMVAPTSVAPSTDITAAAPNKAEMANSQPSALPAPASQIAQNPPPSLPAPMAEAKPMVSSPMPAQAPQGGVVSLPPAGGVAQTVATSAEGASAPVTRENLQATLPQVIPVQSSVGSAPLNVPGGAVTDEQLANLQAEKEKALNQLQTEYTQKISDYEAQNKALQEQVQTLNARMVTMESQLHQLIKALTQQETNPPTSSAEESKLGYNVQAIIPGRAWLKADNGETLTVAEGDNVKSLGRVTKIDPYDGLVEINTGSKVISLSYGSGG